MSHAEFIQAQREKAKRIAREMLAGRIGAVEGAHAICCLQLELAEDDRHGVLETFVVIQSETDALPIGEARQHWAPSALEEKDREIRRSDELYRDVALEACRVILAELEADV